MEPAKLLVLNRFYAAAQIGSRTARPSMFAGWPDRISISGHGERIERAYRKPHNAWFFQDFSRNSFGAWPERMTDRSQPRQPSFVNPRVTERHLS